MLDRRAFLTLLAAGTAGTFAAGCRHAVAGRAGGPLIERVGLGLFSIPHLLEEDFAGTMQLLAEIGYKEIELFGPYPYSVPAAHERWNMLTDALGFQQSGYFGRSAEELRSLLDAHGLTTPSMHIDMETLRTRMPETAEAVNVLGHRYAGISAIPGDRRRSLDDYREIADEFNELGRRAVDNGFRFLYHNHGYGLVPMEGEIPLQVLLERIDPSVVSLEMDIYWTVAGGADPVEYLKAYPEHYRLVHIKDMSEAVRFAGDGGDPQQWMELFPYMTSVGEGVLDLPRTLRQARASGVEHFLVERDLSPEPVDMLRGSYAYLSSLEAEE